MDKLLETPLSQWHIANNAKMADFAGYNMPIQYSGILNEHSHTRSKAGIFDICHMGEFILKGAGATEALSKAVSHNLESLQVGKCRYGFLLNENAGILDDLIIYRMDIDSYFLVVNGSCKNNDYKVLKNRLSQHDLIDISESTAKIDLQGPKSLEVLNKLFGEDFINLAYFSFKKCSYLGEEVLVSRTGYTGELGYELYMSNNIALKVWQDLISNPLVLPIGLGARDTLRLEAGLPLYGHDLDENHTPVEAGFEAMLNSNADFVGKKNIKNVKQKLIALSIDGKRSVRQHDKVFLNNQEVGVITSGSYAPSLEKVIALAYIDLAFSGEESYTVRTSKTQLLAIVTSLPFYTKGTARIKLSS